MVLACTELGSLVSCPVSSSVVIQVAMGRRKKKGKAPLVGSGIPARSGGVAQKQAASTRFNERYRCLWFNGDLTSSTSGSSSSTSTRFSGATSSTSTRVNSDHGSITSTRFNGAHTSGISSAASLERTVASTSTVSSSSVAGGNVVLSNRMKKRLRLAHCLKHGSFKCDYSKTSSLLRDAVYSTSWSYKTAAEVDHTVLITGPDKSLGDCLAMDCEFVGTGMKGKVSILGRCSIVNHHGHVIYDTFVQPLAPVTDYRTLWSGIRKKDLIGAPDFHMVQTRIKELLKGRVLVGHDLRQDLQVLDLEHSLTRIRDTSKHTFNPFTKMAHGRHSKLSTQLKNVRPDVDIQQGEHSSVEDAQAAMVLYQSSKEAWEQSLTA